MKRIRARILGCCVVVVAAVMLAGCPDNDGPVEELGEEIDDVVEELDGR
jgi:hypothetical protein